MTASQQLRIIGGPTETLGRAFDAVRQEIDALREGRCSYDDAMSASRRHIGQGVLDAYSAGKAEPREERPEPIALRKP